MFSDLFWALYWIDVLSGLFGAVVGGAGVILTALVFTVLFTHMFTDTSFTSESKAIGLLAQRKRFLKIQTVIAISLYSLTVMGAFIPSKQTMYIMLGVKTTENVVESPLGKKLQAIIDAEVDGYLKKLTPNKEK
jgi:hypothetical protein